MTQLIDSDEKNRNDKLELLLKTLEPLYDSIIKTMEVYEANIKDVRCNLKKFADTYNQIVDVYQYPMLEKIKKEKHLTLKQIQKIDKKMIYG